MLSQLCTVIHEHDLNLPDLLYSLHCACRIYYLGLFYIIFRFAHDFSLDRSHFVNILNIFAVFDILYFVFSSPLNRKL